LWSWYNKVSIKSQLQHLKFNIASIQIIPCVLKVPELLFFFFITHQHSEYVMIYILCRVYLTWKIIMWVFRNYCVKGEALKASLGIKQFCASLLSVVLIHYLVNYWPEIILILQTTQKAPKFIPHKELRKNMSRRLLNRHFSHIHDVQCVWYFWYYEVEL